MGDETCHVPDLPDDQWPETPTWPRAPNGRRQYGSASLGAATDGWRSLSWRGGDDFAFWAVEVISRRMNRFALLRACVVVAQASGFGRPVRLAVAELLAPDAWNEESEAGMTWPREA